MAHFIQRLLTVVRRVRVMRKEFILMTFFVVVHSVTVVARTDGFCCMDECYGLSQCVLVGCNGCLSQALQTGCNFARCVMQLSHSILVLQQKLMQFVNDIWKPPRSEEFNMFSISFQF